MPILIGFTIMLLANVYLIAVLFIVPLWRKQRLGTMQNSHNAEPIAPQVEAKAVETPQGIEIGGVFYTSGIIKLDGSFTPTLSTGEGDSEVYVFRHRNGDEITLDFKAINTDELCQQALDYERHADTQAIPQFVADSVERRADTELSGDIPTAFKQWNESEDES